MTLEDVQLKRWVTTRTAGNRVVSRYDAQLQPPNTIVTRPGEACKAGVVGRLYLGNGRR
jgi:hypothetical protein